MALRYWVGGTGSWDGTAGTKWATSSGGAGGASVPTTADNVFFTSASGSGTVTIASGNTGAGSIDFTGFTGTLAGSSNMTVAGSVKLSTGMTQNYTGLLTFTASAFITTAGKTFPSFAVDATGGTVTLLSTCTVLATGSVALWNGTLNVNDYSLGCGTFLSSTNTTRALNWGNSGSGIIFLNTTSSGATALSISDARNFSLLGLGAFYRLNSTNATFAFGSLFAPSSPETNAPRIQFASSGPTASTITINSNSYFNRISASSFQGNFAGTNGNVYLYGDALFSTVTDATVLNLYMRGTGNIEAQNGVRSVILDSVNSAVTATSTVYITGGGFQMTNGSFDANNYNIIANDVNVSSTNARTLALGSGVWYISNGSFSAATSDNLTVTGTATIRMAGSSQTFFGGTNITWPTIEAYSPSTSLTINASGCTFGNITTTYNNVALYLRFGQTNYFNNWSYNGDSSGFVTIASDVSGSQATISKPSGVVNVSFAKIKDIVATGGATWVANNCVNNGNNTGWIFNNGGALAAFF